uniref:Uncharacterized protein n=1 Tax=Timema shepardi TaxID=629360 RepID=A0A7R9AJZ2_TIMSH|nr:unnamed protein product [Timema shepardi]
MKGSSGATMSCGVTWVAASLKRGFYKLGVVVGRHPGYFLIIPALLSLACVTGYQRIKYEIDPEYLFSPVWGEGKAERAVVEEFFKPNYTSRFNVGRITRPGRTGQLVSSLVHSLSKRDPSSKSSSKQHYLCPQHNMRERSKSILSSWPGRTCVFVCKHHYKQDSRVKPGSNRLVFLKLWYLYPPEGMARLGERLRNKIEHIGYNEGWPDWSERATESARALER